MKDFETDNIYLVSLVFGQIRKIHLAIATNKTEIEQLAKEIYYQPTIDYIISYSEMREIYTLMKDSSSFYLVTELIKEGDGDRLEHYFEIDQSAVQVKNKYKGRDCIFYTEEIVVEILKLFKQEITDSKNIPLISKSFKV